jgi:hydroxypyruvate isomerase
MSGLKQSGADWCINRQGQAAGEFFGKLKDMGYSGMEMVAPERHSAVLGAGLELLNLGAPGMQHGINNKANHANLIPMIRSALEDASNCNVPSLIIFSGSRGNISREEGLANCSAAIEQILPIAESLGLNLLFEMLCKYDHPDYQADESAFGFELVKSIGSPSLKVLYDIYHMFRMGEDIISDITNNLDIIGHIHVAASPKRSCPALEDEINYAPIVKAVHKAGYRGYWGQEFIIEGDVLDEMQKACNLFNGFV